MMGLTQLDEVLCNFYFLFVSSCPYSEVTDFVLVYFFVSPLLFPLLLLLQ